MHCLQEVRWRGQSSWMLGMNGRGCKGEDNMCCLQEVRWGG